MAQLILSCLGSFRITLGGRPVNGFESNKVRALLAYLAIESDRPHSRDALVGLLWPDQLEKTAHAALSQALSNLRRTIGDMRAQSPFLTILRDSIQFNVESDHRLDVAEFIVLLRRCRQHAHRHPQSCCSCMERLQAAADSYRGDLLEDLSPHGSPGFDEWVMMKRERLRRLALEVLFDLAECQNRHRSYEQAYQLAMRQIELDPWREEAYRQAMQALALRGERNAALAQYHSVRLVLERDLGIAPTAETTALYKQIKDESLAPNRAPPPGNPSWLPTLTTRLVGREAELVYVIDRLEEPNCRLLTLTGPGGVGKTHLAIEAASRCIGSFAHGVCFISATELRSMECLVSAIAEAVGLLFSGSARPVAQLLHHLHEKDMLLVVDGFDHLVPVAGPLITILQKAPRLVLLVTSCERLGLPAEWVIEVAELPYPCGNPIQPIETYDAVKLFLQRASMVQPDFWLSPHNAPYVACICKLVEGLPLAMELAAAKLSAFSCKDIADEIERDLGFLSEEPRDATLSPRSMMSVFDRLWDRLSADERGAVWQLSDFRNGFSKNEAERMAGVSTLVLAKLVNKSLVRKLTGGRYKMYEFIRRYARERLQKVTDTEQLLGASPLQMSTHRQVW